MNQDFGKLLLRHGNDPLLWRESAYELKLAADALLPHYLDAAHEAPSVPGNTNINLGLLSSSSGAQSYSVPAGVSLGDYSYVLIHCEQFNHWWGGGLMGEIDCGTATNNVDSDLSTSIYPNPSNGIIYFKELEPGTSLQIFNVSGNMILSQKQIDSPQLDLRHLEKGVYYMNLNHKKGTRIASVIIE